MEDRWRELQTLRAQLKRQKRQLDRTADASYQRAKRLRRASVSMREILLVFFWAALAVQADAVLMLRHSSRRDRVKDQTDAEIASALEATFAATPVADVLLIIDSAVEKRRRLVQEAFCLYAELSAIRWVQNANKLRGLAVPSYLISARYDEALQQAPPHVHSQLRQLCGAVANRTWTHRLRQRWRGKIGRILSNHVDPPARLRRKVLGFQSGSFWEVVRRRLSWATLLARFRGPVCVPIFGAVASFFLAAGWSGPCFWCQL